MKTVDEIRKELRYTVKFLHNLPESTLEEYRKNKEYQEKLFSLVEKYDKYIENAHPTLKKIYKFLYVEGLTQKDAGYYLCYSEKYVQRKNKELILYFQKCFGWYSYQDKHTPNDKKISKYIILYQSSTNDRFVCVLVQDKHTSHA